MNNLTRYYGPENIKGWRMIAVAVGAIGCLIMLAWALVDPTQREQALRSWLIGFVFWAGITFGSLGFLMLQYLISGAWGVVGRRVLEAATRTLPIVVVLFIPIALGVYSGTVYTWTHLPPTEHTMVQRGIFMTPAMWILRSVVYFALFGVMIYFLNK